MYGDQSGKSVHGHWGSKGEEFQSCQQYFKKCLEVTKRDTRDDKEERR